MDTQSRVLESLTSSLFVKHLQKTIRAAAVQTHVSTGILSTRTKHVVRVLVDGARVHEKLFVVDKKLGQTTKSQRVKAEKYCMAITCKLSKDPACKSFTVIEEIDKEPLTLTEAQLRKLENLDS